MKKPMCSCRGEIILTNHILGLWKCHDCGKTYSAVDVDDILKDQAFALKNPKTAK